MRIDKADADLMKGRWDVAELFVEIDDDSSEIDAIWRLDKANCSRVDQMAKSHINDNREARP